MSTRDERDALAQFRERYTVADTDVAGEIEERVIGARWGANGYTTLEQADELARRLALGPGIRLLDVGTGRGWPGVYFAVGYRSTVVGSDMPVEALAAASARAGREGASGRVFPVVAAGGRQPFRPASFDAIVHTDVLC